MGRGFLLPHRREHIEVEEVCPIDPRGGPESGPCRRGRLRGGGLHNLQEPDVDAPGGQHPVRNRKRPICQPRREKKGDRNRADE